MITRLHSRLRILRRQQCRRDRPTRVHFRLLFRTSAYFKLALIVFLLALLTLFISLTYIVHVVLK